MPDLSLQHRFELITAPAAEPVTVTDAKKQMRIEHSDDDALIARLINVAIGFVDVRGALGKAMNDHGGVKLHLIVGVQKARMTRHYTLKAEPLVMKAEVGQVEIKAERGKK